MPHSALQDILILLSAAVVVVTFFRKLNLSPVLGYLFAGILIGPYGLELITYNSTTAYLAEFGVVFLLFYIGLELSLERLKSMWRYVFGLGALQVILTSVAFIGICLWMGMDHATAIIIGTGLSLSSTAVVLKVISEQGEEMSKVGRTAISVLIFQDIIVVFLLVLVPLLKRDAESILPALGMAGLKALGALIVIAAVGRFLIKPLFNFIGALKSEEVFSATTLLVVLLSAFATEHFGLSLALGAFLAGLMMAETEFRHQVEADILPYKSLLLGLFFLSIGMLMDIDLLRAQIGTILLLSAVVLAVKGGIIFLLCRLFGFKNGSALHSALLLAQIGEFAFILFGLANRQHLLADETHQMLLVAVSLTMALTPLMSILGKRIARRLKRNLKLTQEELEHETSDLSSHIIVAGFGRVGRVASKVLLAQKEPFIAIDSDIRNVRDGRKLGIPVVYGDASNPEVLHSLGIKRARALIVTINDKRASSKIASIASREIPGLPIIARAWDVEHIKQLEKSGARHAVAEAFEIGLQMVTSSLSLIGNSEQEVDYILKTFRQEDYRLLKELAAKKAQAS